MFAVISSSQLSVGPAGWGWYRVAGHDSRCVSGQPGDSSYLAVDGGWGGWGWTGCWSLVGKLHKMVRCTGECEQSQFHLPRVGLSLSGCVMGCVFPLTVWPALDVSPSDAGEAGYLVGTMFNCDSGLFVKVSYSQKCARSLIICIFRYSLLSVHGTGASDVLRCWRGITWALLSLIGSFSCNRAALCWGSIL